MAQMAKSLPVMQETRVQSLGQEDPLEKGMATHSSILAWKILWREEPGGLQSVESQKVRLSLSERCPWVLGNTVRSCFLKKFLNFIWLRQVFLAAHKIFSCGMWDLTP